MEESSIEVNESNLGPATEHVRNDLWSLLEGMKGRYGVTDERKSKQRAILDHLPPDFWIDFRGHLLAVKYEDEIYGRETQGDEQELFRVAKGKLFEELVRNEQEKSFGKETQMAVHLRRLMSLPKRYNLQGLVKSVRNPDLARINEKGEIVGWVECKTGALDWRSLVQLKESGFQKGFSHILEVIKSINDDVLLSHGLSVFSQGNKERLHLSKTLKRLLVVPWGNYQPEKEEFLPTKKLGREKRKKLLDIISLNYQVDQSPFSSKELDVLTQYLVNKFLRLSRETVKRSQAQEQKGIS